MRIGLEPLWAYRDLPHLPRTVGWHARTTSRAPGPDTLGLGRQRHRGSIKTLPDGAARDRFTLGAGDVRQLGSIVANIRSVRTVNDAYRVVGG